MKLTTPDVVTLVVVPLSTPPPGFEPMASVIVAVEEVAVLPKLSRTVTVGGPGIGPPAVALPGCIVKAKLLADPGSTVKGALLPADSASPLVRLAVRTTPLSALV
jgi:hypothetical protein